MEKREAPGKFFDPCDRVCTALLNPVSVRLAFEIFGGRGGIEDIQHSSAVELFEFEGVVVIAQGDSCGFQPGADFIESRRQLEAILFAGPLDMGVRIRCVGAFYCVKAFNDFVGFIEKQSAGVM